jgi:hypothetical protein
MTTTSGLSAGEQRQPLTVIAVVLGEPRPQVVGVFLPVELPPFGVQNHRRGVRRPVGHVGQFVVRAVTVGETGRGLGLRGWRAR